MPECECSCTNAQYKVQLYFSILTNAGCVCCAVRARYNSERATIQMMIHANQIDRYLSTVMLLALVWCLTTLCVATGNFTIARKKKHAIYRCIQWLCIPEHRTNRIYHSHCISVCCRRALCRTFHNGLQLAYTSNSLANETEISGNVEVYIYIYVS